MVDARMLVGKAGAGDVVRTTDDADKSSVCTRVIERLYGNSHLLNDAGQYAYYGRVAGCLVTGPIPNIVDRGEQQL